MRRKRRKKTKKIIIIFSLSLLFIMAVGYAAFSTNLNITAKGNITRKVFTISEFKNEYCNATAGDGLYVDTFENNRCVYKGINPNNYIEIDDSLWRILAIESDDTLKIIKNDSIGKQLWDTGVGVWGYNNWARPAVINSYLNNDYYNLLSEDFKSIIESHAWNTGAATHGNNDLASQIVEEKSIIWNGKIGLISASDYLKANSNVNECGNWSLNNSNWEICMKTNFLIQAERFWTITAYDKIIQDTSTVVCNINSNGGVSGESAGYGAYDIFPTVYLNSNIKLYGNGTESNPYKIEL